MVLAETIAGVGLLKSALEIAKTIKDQTDESARASVAIDLQQKILEAQEQQMSLVLKVSELEERITAFDNWETEKKRYELKPAGEHTDALAFQLKEECLDGEHPHKICASCFQEGRKSILQAETRFPGACEVLICHRCGADIYVIGNWMPEHAGRKSKKTIGRSSR